MNFQEICQNKLKEKGLGEDKRYLKRLKWEVEEIIAKEKENYFLDLYNNKVKYPFNQNNLLVCWLLDIVNDYNVEQEPKVIFGDFADVDCDYSTSLVRDYVKNVWAPKTFGEDRVCNIGVYTTYGLKNALIDMARVHGLSRDEILAVTKNLSVKDDEGDALTWDSAMRLCPELKKYDQEHPEVTEAAKKLAHRIRGTGVHAGGLIISSVDLPDFVPLIKRKDSPQASAWVEGLQSQDLQPVGLVKFDLLIVSNLQQIAFSCHLIKQRHNVDGICALKGQPDWSDVDKWRFDKKALQMANRGDLKGIFQFDGEGIRNLVKMGGVDRFEDLVAYSALFRPGCMAQKMHTRYCDRKKGREKFSLHPVLRPILKKTYGILCVHEDTIVSLSDGREIEIKNLSKGEFVHSYNEKTKEFEEKECVWVGATSKTNGVNICLENGNSVIVTKEHKILTHRGWVEAKDLNIKEDLVATHSNNLVYLRIKAIKDVGVCQFYDLSVKDNHNFIGNGIVLHNCFQEDIMLVLNVVGKIPLKDCYAVIKAVSKKKLSGFLKYKDAFIANGQQTLNLPEKEVVELWNLIEAFSEYGFSLNHATAYNYISMYLLYLKAHYTHEFYAGLLTFETDINKIKDLKMEAKLHDVIVERLDINKSCVNFELKENIIYYGFSKIKGIGEGPSEKIVKNQPYKSFEDFLAKFGTEASVLKPLIGLRCFNDASPIVLWKFSEYYKEYVTKREIRLKKYSASMERYEIQFKNFVPDETRLLSDLKGEFPFEDEEWKKCDYEKEVTVIKKARCKPEQGTERKLSIVDVEIYDGVFIERDAYIYYKAREVRKKFNVLKELKRLWGKRRKSISLKNSIGELPTLANFKPEEHEIKKEMALELQDPVACEIKYYGFSWIHELETSPDFKGFTFEALKTNIDVASAPVEIKINKITKAVSKKNTNYYQILAEDVTGQTNKIYIWQEDSERWEQELKEGNLLRMRLQPPSGGWNTFTLEPNQVGKYRGILKYQNKDEDPRVFVMKKGVRIVESYLTNEQVLEVF